MRGGSECSDFVKLQKSSSPSPLCAILHHRGRAFPAALEARALLTLHCNAEGEPHHNEHPSALAIPDLAHGDLTPLDGCDEVVAFGDGLCELLELGAGDGCKVAIWMAISMERRQ